MKLRNLIQEPTYERVLDVLLDTAQYNGFKFAEPTPLISPFWKTTFTPSSSEAIFRHLDKSGTSGKFYTVQPCIRINDLPHLSDGWHCLLFHMVSFFLLDTTKIEEALAVILKTIVSATNLNLSDFYFTVPTNQYCPTTLSHESLGADILEKIGVSSEQMIWCAGSDNYQDNSLVTAEGQKISMTGPKVEIFVKPPNQEKLYEVATCEVATCVSKTVKHGGSSFGNVFACAIGLERLTTISNGKTSIFALQGHQDISNLLCTSLLHPSMTKTLLGSDVLNQVILILEALVHIAMYKEIGLKYNRGIINHQSRLVKYFCRLLKSIGISIPDFLKHISDSTSFDIRNLINATFLEEITKNKTLDYL